METSVASLDYYQCHRVHITHYNEKVQKDILHMPVTEIKQVSESKFYEAMHTITNVVTGLHVRVERDGDVIKNLSNTTKGTHKMQAEYAAMQTLISNQEAELKILHPLAKDHAELERVR
jgi:hypothetical protein